METGNIVFVVQEEDHETFERLSADLSATITISLREALCGFSRVVVKHLDGRGISITHPRGKVLKQGQVLKVAGEGMPYKKGDHKGDLYLKVEVEFPTEEWLKKPGNLEKLEAALPMEKPAEFKADLVDDVEFDAEASMRTVCICR